MEFNMFKVLSSLALGLFLVACHPVQTCIHPGDEIVNGKCVFMDRFPDGSYIGNENPVSAPEPEAPTK